MQKIALILFLSLGINISFAADNRTPDFQTTKTLAEQGVAEAQTNLGIMYHLGIDVKQDYFEAAKWDRLAAEQGDAQAQNILGFMYSNGKGVKLDFIEAAKWTRLAAEQGNANAQYFLGAMYSNGRGVKQDKAETKRWYGKACDNKSEAGCEAFKGLYEEGY